jgi:hypothetical protein
MNRDGDQFSIYHKGPEGGVGERFAEVVKGISVAQKGESDEILLQLFFVASSDGFGEITRIVGDFSWRHRDSTVK